MIKRYTMGRVTLAKTDNSSLQGAGIVECENGEFYHCADIDPLLESIGAGGVSGRVVKKTIQQQYAEFKEWCEGNRHLDLDSRLHTHSGPIGKGGYISDEKTRAAFAAWRAARDITE